MDLLAVDNVLELGGAVRGLTRVGDTKSLESGDDGAWHAKSDGVSGTVVDNGHTYEFGSVPVEVEVVLGANGVEEVIRMGAIAVLDREVVDDKGKVSIVDFVLK